MSLVVLGCLLACASAQQIYHEPVFDVKSTTDVKYAQGLTCAADSRSDCQAKDLLLDLYEPVAKSDGPALPDLKPAYIVAHGGGNVGGSKEMHPLKDKAQFFASRGFVAFNIDYRLGGEHGLLPAGDEPAHPADGRSVWANAYPAARDCKAAIRYVRANAAKYGVDPERVAVSGGSAGAANMLAVGATFDADYKGEISVDVDPTLASTHLEFSSHPQCVVAHWSTDGEIDLARMYDPQNRTRYSNKNTPVLEFHGNKDTTLPIARARVVQEAYAETGVDYQLHVLEGCAHGAWCYDGKGKCKCQSGTQPYVDYMDRIALPFVAKHLNLSIVTDAVVV